MSQRQYTFTMSDSLYSPNLPQSFWEDLLNKNYFYAIEKNVPTIPINFDKLIFNKNTVRITKLSKDSTYIGHFKFHRVVFDKTKQRAFVQVEGIPLDKMTFVFILRKEKGKWMINSY